LEIELYNSEDRDPNIETTLDQYIEEILPKLYPFSNEIGNSDDFEEIRWLEFNDNSVSKFECLHIFMPHEEYMQTWDGNLSIGSWRLLKDKHSMVTEMNDKKELYDIEFINDKFFILSKQGNQKSKGTRKFVVLGKEDLISKLTFEEKIAFLCSEFKFNFNYIWMISVVVIILGLMFYFK
jgi:hypothetical protein